MNWCLVDIDLLDQDLEVVVNEWNRNLIPCWLLFFQGMFRCIKKRVGAEPFREVSRKGILPLGGAVETGSGKLPFKAIIHVAGISLLWRSSEWSIRESACNAMANANSDRSIAYPFIGAGSGCGWSARVRVWMKDELQRIDFDGIVVLVRFKYSKALP